MLLYFIFVTCCPCYSFALYCTVFYPSSFLTLWEPRYTLYFSRFEDDKIEAQCTMYSFMCVDMSALSALVLVLFNVHIHYQVTVRSHGRFPRRPLANSTLNFGPKKKVLP